MGPPAAASALVSLRASAAMRHSDCHGLGGLWPALERSLRAAGVALAPMDEARLGQSPELCGTAAPVPWACLESEFAYAPHRVTCGEPFQGAGREELIGTRFPLVLLFAPPTSAGGPPALLREDALGALTAWLKKPPRPFGPRVRTILVLVGGLPGGGARAAASSSSRSSKERQALTEAASAALVRFGVGTVEVRGVDEAARYAAQCAASVAECRRRRVPSRFKVPGVRCQTLPRDPQDKLRLTWVSQLMQIAGVSEEIAKVIAERHPSPAAIMEAVEAAAAAAGAAAGAAGGGGAGGGAGGQGGEGGPLSAAADSFLADLEYPIRGKKGTRRLGPVVSRRLFALFHPEVSAEHVLV